MKICQSGGGGGLGGSWEGCWRGHRQPIDVPHADESRLIKVCWALLTPAAIGGWRRKERWEDFVGFSLALSLSRSLSLSCFLSIFHFKISSIWFSMDGRRDGGRRRRRRRRGMCANLKREVEHPNHKGKRKSSHQTLLNGRGRSHPRARQVNWENQQSSYEQEEKEEKVEENV